MKEIIGRVFASVLELLIEQGHVKLEDYFVDGSKLEANARRHSGCGRRILIYAQRLAESPH